MNALMHYFFKEDPENWDDEKFTRKWAQCEWLLDMFKNNTIG